MHTWCSDCAKTSTRDDQSHRLARARQRLEIGVNDPRPRLLKGRAKAISSLPRSRPGYVHRAVRLDAELPL